MAGASSRCHLGCLLQSGWGRREGRQEVPVLVLLAEELLAPLEVGRGSRPLRLPAAASPVLGLQDLLPQSSVRGLRLLELPREGGAAEAPAEAGGRRGLPSPRVRKSTLFRELTNLVAPTVC